MYKNHGPELRDVESNNSNIIVLQDSILASKGKDGIVHGYGSQCVKKTAAR
jgi:hypothetical protein